MFEVLVLTCVVVLLWATFPSQGPYSPQEEDWWDDHK